MEGGVSHSIGEGGGRSAMLLAAGNERPPAIRKCRADCLSCPALNRSKKFISNISGRVHSTIDVNQSSKLCKFQNFIYLLSCNSCNIQYVGESISPLHMRMNIHRTGKTGCSHCIEHFSNVCPGSTFTIQVIEKLPGNGYINGSIDATMREYRLKREDFWMKTLRTVYPYGLNEKTKFMSRNVPIGKLFPPLPRTGNRLLNNGRMRNKNSENRKLANLDCFIAHLNNFNIKQRSNECRKTLEGFRKQELRKLALQASKELTTSDDDNIRLLKLILDTAFTKCFKEEPSRKRKSPEFLFPMYFCNKGLSLIRMSCILHDKDVIASLPTNLQSKEVPSVVYKLGKTIRNSIFNYRQTVNNIDVNDKETFGTGIKECDCQTSAFINNHHNHVITGDLRFITNDKLRSLLSHGPNYREPKTINWRKCRETIGEGLESCAAGLTKFLSNEDDNLTDWKKIVMEKVDLKISHLKHKTKPRKSGNILKQPEVENYLKDLHNKYVLVPIDKAANNVAIICKKHYVQVLMKEIGILGSGNETYVRAKHSNEEIIDENVEYSKRLGLSVIEKDKALPIMYWTPKMHKTPTGARFIVASKTCSTKVISKSVSSVFKLIYKQINNFHKNAKFLSNYNKFWVLQNSDPVLHNMKRINRKNNAKSIATYDFSTLYTKIPHEKLIKQLILLIDFAFDGGDKDYIRVGPNGEAFWGKKVKGKVGFTKSSLIKATKHLIENCYFDIGNLTLKQDIGIPMGIDPAPFWANLFLYTYEEAYMSDLIKEDKIKARHFHSTNRFIDDLCALNDGGEFGRVYKEIYPEELELKVEHSGSHASFLNLDININ